MVGLQRLRLQQRRPVQALADEVPFGAGAQQRRLHRDLVRIVALEVGGVDLDAFDAALLS